MNPTDAQRGAIESDHPRILVVAGAGTGKTWTLLERVKRLLVSVDPQEIAIVTYTNAAAGVIEKRLGEDVRLGFLGTLHGLCARRIEQSDAWERIQIMDDAEAREMREQIARNVGLKAGDPLVEKIYLRDCLAYGRFDYDLLLSTALSLWRGNSYQRQWSHLFVDEYQDASPIDAEIYEAIGAENRYVTGDPRQAIFGFRGGDVSQIESLIASPKWEKHELALTFRCGEAICAGANGLMNAAEMAGKRPETRPTIIRDTIPTSKQP